MYPEGRIVNGNKTGIGNFAVRSLQHFIVKNPGTCRGRFWVYNAGKAVYEILCGNFSAFSVGKNLAVVEFYVFAQVKV